ncbi:response regulator [Clostridium sp. D33t1_170424_F3]|uniref:response regulator n=1 Tax=Clostridium sp. D33t1_170424_F3 TaxID=2787099 RepID=UPI0018ABFCE9|nr:response regulator [Clostridium sp. D33t1_170424_F3]
MKILIVDDEPLAAEELADTCGQISGLEIAGVFLNAAEALSYAESHPVDLAFLDIEMPGIQGLELAHRLHAINEKIAIVFVTGFKKYAFDAFNADAYGYILKPFERESIQKIIDRVRRIAKPVEQKKAVIRTFGRFGLFVDDTPVDFKSHKAKELFALLISQSGALSDMDFIIGTLWEEEQYDSKVKGKYRKACMYLRQALEKAGLGETLISVRGKLGVNCEPFDCDYFRVLNGDARAAASFTGEFLFEYSWAEELLPSIQRKVELILEKNPQACV